MFCHSVSISMFWNISKIPIGQSRNILSVAGNCRYLSNSSAPSRDRDQQKGQGNEEGYKKNSVKDVMNHGVVDEKVRVQGWIRAYRKMKENLFLDLSDGTSEQRLVIVEESSAAPKGLGMHTAVDVSGVLQRNPKNPSLLEVHPTVPIRVIGECDQKEYPFGGKIRYTPDYIRQYTHLRPKTNRFSSILRLRSEMARAVHDYFTNNGFCQVHVPILTSNDCEGAGEIFTVQPENKDLIKDMRSESATQNNSKAGSRSDEEVFFNKKVHLSVSSQLHLESVASGLDKVWTFSPVFRAENSKSTRHLSEFYMIEAELAFAYEIEQILDVMESLVRSCVRKVLTECVGDWTLQLQASDKETNLQKVLENVLKHPFTVMTFDEASKLLQEKANSIVPPGKGLNREQELILVEKLNDDKPVFVIDWPAEIKPFYMRECSYNPAKVSAVDLLVPTVGELCGGSLRESDVTKLIAKINAHDPSGNLLESLSWYTDLRKYGGTPTGGFGLGFDRLIQLITGIGNIKDVNPFPRWAHHCPM